MKKYSFIKATFSLLVVVAACMATSCKSSEEDFLDNMFKLPDHLYLEYGMETQVILPDFPEDQKVFPAAAFDLSLSSEDESIVKVLDGGTVIAVGGGHTELYVYGKGQKLLRKIPVEVLETHSYQIKVGQSIYISEIIGSEYKYSSRTGLFSSNPATVYAGWEFSTAKYYIEGKSAGTAFVGSQGSYYNENPFLINVTVTDN